MPRIIDEFDNNPQIIIIMFLLFFARYQGFKRSAFDFFASHFRDKRGDK